MALSGQFRPRTISYRTISKRSKHPESTLKRKGIFAAPCGPLSKAFEGCFLVVLVCAHVDR